MTTHYGSDTFDVRQARGAMAHHKGKSAEMQVAQHFETRGAKILETRWRGQGGEIDLILQQGDEIVFVEVKSSRTHDQALAQVSGRQLHRICDSAAEYLDLCPQGSLTPMRLDIAMVDAQGRIDLLENALMTL